MKASEFCYWLQGFFELREVSIKRPKYLSVEQVELIERHLALVFAHDLDPAQVADKLQQIHDGKPPQLGGVGPDGEIYRC